MTDTVPNKYRVKYRPYKCPDCGSRKVAHILYGYPNFDDKMKGKLDSGELVLGGCELLDDAPAWQCVDCEMNIYREK